jgi:hypothetical protein
LGLAVDDSPIDGSSPAIEREKRGMKVKGTKGRKTKDFVGKHPESHYNLQVRL